VALPAGRQESAVAYSEHDRDSPAADASLRLPIARQARNDLSPTTFLLLLPEPQTDN